MVETVKSLKNEHKISFRSIAKFAPSIAYSTFMRWKARLEKGLVPSMAPGPKKAMPLDVYILEGKIKSLHHKRKIMHGSAPLYFSYKDAIFAQRASANSHAYQAGKNARPQA